MGLSAANNKRSRHSGASAPIFKCLTILALAGFLCIGGWFLYVFINPQSTLNPFSPLLNTVITQQSSPIPSQPILPSLTPLSSATSLPTQSPTPTSTSARVLTNTPPPTVLLAVPPQITPSEFSFVVQQESPIAIQNNMHLDLDCGWTGVGGQAFDLSGAPVLGLVVKLRGSFAGISLDVLSLTGSAAQIGYGPGGYEFTLGDEPIDSNSTLSVQLVDHAGLPLSDEVVFSTFADCDKNLILINFVQQN